MPCLERVRAHGPQVSWFRRGRLGQRSLELLQRRVPGRHDGQPVADRSGRLGRALGAAQRGPPPLIDFRISSVPVFAGCGNLFLSEGLSMSPMRPADGPSRRELDQVREQVRPDLEDLFRQHGISQVDAERLLREALMRLAYQWDRIRNRSWWLLDSIETAARELSQPSTPEDFDDV